MLKAKRIVAVVACAALTCCLAVALAGCGGGGVAATWAHGDIKEDDITARIENMRSSYGMDDNATLWESFIRGRSYDPDAGSEDEESADSGDDASAESSADDAGGGGDASAEKAGGDGGEDAGSGSEEGADEDGSDEGTVEDLRKYVIEQVARNEAVKWEAKQRDVQVNDEDLDAFVDERKAEVEGQYMKGTFESVLRQQGYASIEEYRQEVRDNLFAIYKLQEEVTDGHDENDEDWDSYEDTWDEFVDGLMENAELHINDMPSGLPYDPATLAESEGSDEGSEDGESNESADGESSESADGADADADSAGETASEDDGKSEDE